MLSTLENMNSITTRTLTMNLLLGKKQVVVLSILIALTIAIVLGDSLTCSKLCVIGLIIPVRFVCIPARPSTWELS